MDMHRFVGVGVVVVACALAGGGCASAERERAGSGAQPASEAEVKHGIQPYSVAEVRAAMPVGAGFSLRVERGAEVTIEEMLVVAADADTCTMAIKVTDAAGKLIEDRGTRTTSWLELHEHAKFAPASTVRGDGHLTVPVGVFDTWLYVVDVKDEQGREVQTLYHFAKTLPGPPVLMIVTVDGKMVLRMTMVGRR